MTSETAGEKDLRSLLLDEDGMLESLTQGVREAVRRDLLLGFPVVVWRNGAVHWIQPTDPEALELIHGKQPS